MMAWSSTSESRVKPRHRLVLATIAALALVFFALEGHQAWRERLFDQWLRLEFAIFGAEPSPANVFVVAVGEDSARSGGGWPWQRARQAALLFAIAEQKPAVVAMDIFFPHYSGYPVQDDYLLQSLTALPGLTLAHAMTTRDTASFVTRSSLAQLATGGFLARPESESRLMHTDAWLFPNFGEVDQVAKRHGFITADWLPEPIYRRLPLFVRRGDHVAASFSAAATLAYLDGLADMIRIEETAQGWRFHGEPARSDMIGPAPTDAQGMSRPRFRPVDLEAQDRRIEANSLLTGDAKFPELEGAIVLVGVDAVAAGDFGHTAFGLASGVEIQAQTVESLLAGSMLKRPPGLCRFELAAGLLIALTVITALPYLSLRQAFVLMAAWTLVSSATAFAAIPSADLLVDVLPPVGTALALLAGVVWTRVDVIQRQRRQALRRQLRLEAEMNAAGEMQLSILPQCSRIAGLPSNVRIEAVLAQARFVGGDFYDAFMVDDTRLFFIVADVSGKGPEGAFFMAIAKAFIQSAALDRGGGDPGATLRRAEREIMRNNPKDLFVTAIAGLLDTRTGELAMCNAGHPPPLLLDAKGQLRYLEAHPAPAVGMVPGFAFVTILHQLQPGDTLLAFTDGLAELTDRGEGRALEEFSTFIESCYGREQALPNAKTIVAMAIAGEGRDRQDDITMLITQIAAFDGTGTKRT